MRVYTDHLEDEYLNGAAAYLKYRCLISLEDQYGTKFGTKFNKYMSEEEQ